MPTVFTTRKSGGEEKARRHCSHRYTDLGQLRVISVYQQIRLLYFSVWVWEIKFILITICFFPVCVRLHLVKTKS